MVAFWCYDPSGDQSGGVHRWYDEQFPKVRSEIDGALEVMQHERVLDDLGVKRFKRLRGKCAGLAEIKIDFKLGAEKINVRLLGPYEPPTTEFILLVGFLKKGGPDYGPACRTAHNRHRGVKRRARKKQPCRFP
jgi:hypothetical protein